MTYAEAVASGRLVSRSAWRVMSSSGPRFLHRVNIGSAADIVMVARFADGTYRYQFMRQVELSERDRVADDWEFYAETGE